MFKSTYSFSTVAGALSPLIDDILHHMRARGLVDYQIFAAWAEESHFKRSRLLLQYLEAMHGDARLMEGFYDTISSEVPLKALLV
jgi:hypothetical protein